MRIILLALTISLHTYGQFSKNIILLNGFGSYSFEKNSNSYEIGRNSSEDFSIGTSSGYFVLNKLVIGRTFNLSSINQERSYSSSFNNTYPINFANVKSASHTWEIGPFIRYYLYKGAFIEMDYLYGKGRISDKITTVVLISPNNVGSSSYTTSQKKIESNLFACGIGYTFIVNKSRNLGFDFSIFYKYHNQEELPFSGLSLNLAILGFLSVI